MRRWNIGWRRIAATVALLLGGVGWPLGATLFMPLTPEQLTARSDRVAHGKVGALEARRDAAGRLFTRVTLEACEFWQGTGSKPDGSMEIELGGGVLGAERRETLGQASFAIGDEVVLFLVRIPAGGWTVLGLEQGRFEVLRSADAGAGGPWVRNLFWGGSPVAASGVPEIRPPHRRPLTLAELKRRVLEVRR